MGHMHFDISIPLVSNIKLIVAKTNSWHIALYVPNEEKRWNSGPLRQVYTPVDEFTGKKSYLDPGFPFTI